MEDINDVVAVNLRLLREERRLSLDAMAQLTGVSKSMIAQIERGAVNPTVSTVWKIANGMKVPFSALIARAEEDTEVVKGVDTKVLTEDGGRYRNFTVFPLDASRKFDFFRIEIDPGGRLQAEPHPEGTREFIIVYAGTLRVDANGESYVVKGGDAIRFKADTAHSYENTGKTMCRLAMVIYYK